MTDLVALEQHGHGILVLSLQDAAGLNRFRSEFIEQLLVGLAAIGADPTARVCIVRGLEQTFCAGADLSLLEELVGGARAPADLLLPRAVLDLPIPTIAAMEGHAVGGGLTFGLCCDLVLIAKESRYGCTFMNMGFTPGMGTTALLQDAMGEYIASEMMFGGQLFRGAHFAGRTNINYVLPRAEVYPTAMRLAQRIAEKPRYALELLKRHLSSRRRQLFEAARTQEIAMHSVCFSRPEIADQIRDNYAAERGATGAGDEK
jgi:polyketide biosynthesis enoyl-CoA hydratase PksI